MSEAMAALDAWCKKRAAGLTERSSQHIMAGGSLSDPQYRVLLGEHRAYMAMRAFIHCSRLTHNPEHPHG